MGVWISQASIDKRQMDLHGSGLFRMGKKGQRESAGQLLFSWTTTAVEKIYPSPLIHSGPLKKFNQGFKKTFQQTTTQKHIIHTHVCTHTRTHI